MMAVQILAGLLLVVLAAVLALILLPLSYRCNLQVQQGHLAWQVQTMRLLTMQYSTMTNQSSLSMAGIKMGWFPGKKPSRNKEKKQPLSPSPGPSLTQWMDGQLVRLTLQMILRIMAHMLPRTIRITGRIGLDDPYATGILFILLSLLERVPRTDVQLQPVWDDWEHDVRIHISGRIVLLVLLTYGVRFYFSQPVRRWRKSHQQPSPSGCNPFAAHSV